MSPKIHCLECSYSSDFREWPIRTGVVVCPLCGTPEGEVKPLETLVTAEGGFQPELQMEEAE